jgi:hypothetical protein
MADLMVQSPHRQFRGNTLRSGRTPFHRRAPSLSSHRSTAPVELCVAASELAAPRPALPAGHRPPPQSKSPTTPRPTCSVPLTHARAAALRCQSPLFDDTTAAARPPPTGLLLLQRGATPCGSVSLSLNGSPAPTVSTTDGSSRTLQRGACGSFPPAWDGKYPARRGKSVKRASRWVGQASLHSDEVRLRTLENVLSAGQEERWAIPFVLSAGAYEAP